MNAQEHRKTRELACAHRVVRAVRHALDRGHLSNEDAVELALLQLLRPGGPGARISIANRTRLREAVRHLARELDVTQPRSILQFAKGASQAAWTLAVVPRHPGASFDEAVNADPRALARAALYAEAAYARDSEDHIRRALTRAIRERKRMRGVSSIHLADNDPLRTVLDVPARGRVLLPKNDLRVHIAAAARATTFGDVLRLAARFSEEIVRPVLGEELWALGRPVGFSDRKQSRVLIETSSVSKAHEIQLRSPELVHRLKSTPGFENTKSVKIIVVEPNVLLVKPGPRTAS